MNKEIKTCAYVMWLWQSKEWALCSKSWGLKLPLRTCFLIGRSLMHKTFNLSILPDNSLYFMNIRFCTNVIKVSVVNEKHNSHLKEDKKIFFSKAKYEGLWPKNTDSGRSRICVPVWLQFHEIFIGSEQKKKNHKSAWFSSVLMETSGR